MLLIPVGYVIVALVVVVLARQVPSMIAVEAQRVILTDFWRLRSKSIAIDSISRIEYVVGHRDLGKPVERRYFSVILYSGTGRVAFYCDGSIAKGLMGTLPKERSKLMVYLSPGRLEEKEIEV